MLGQFQCCHVAQIPDNAVDKSTNFQQIYPYPAAKMSSDKFLVCYQYQGTSDHSKSVKILSEYQTDWIRVRRRASHPDPSCLNMEIWSRSAG